MEILQRILSVLALPDVFIFEGSFPVSPDWVEFRKLDPSYEHRDWLELADEMVELDAKPNSRERIFEVVFMLDAFQLENAVDDHDYVHASAG